MLSTSWCVLSWGESVKRTCSSPLLRRCLLSSRFTTGLDDFFGGDFVPVLLCSLPLRVSLPDTGDMLDHNEANDRGVMGVRCPRGDMGSSPMNFHHISLLGVLGSSIIPRFLQVSRKAFLTRLLDAVKWSFSFSLTQRCLCLAPVLVLFETFSLIFESSPNPKK